jgi:signal transduction histidine kinase
LRQAVGNLIDNAQRHGSGRIELLANKSDSMIEIHALDEGAGIPDGLIDTAFERFSRADTAREGEGAGLGLSIVAAVANAHGGTVGVGDRPDGRADVWLSLPSVPVTEAGKASA